MTSSEKKLQQNARQEFKETYQKNETAKSRNYMVVKKNDIIQRSKFSYTTYEQKTIAYICSLIKPELNKDLKCYIGDTEHKYDFTFNINEYCQILGLYDGGRQYAEIKALFKKLADRSIWLTKEDADGKPYQTLLRWFTKIVIKEGTVNVRIHEDMMPYLYDLQECFTEYSLKYILSMKSGYSVRLYEVLCSYSDEIIFKLEEIREILAANSIAYEKYSKFNERVLKVAVGEINKYTDLSVVYIPIKTSHKVTAIKFIFRKKSPSELIQPAIERERKFGDGNISL